MYRPFNGSYRTIISENRVEPLIIYQWIKLSCIDVDRGIVSIRITSLIACVDEILLSLPYNVAAIAEALNVLSN